MSRSAPAWRGFGKIGLTGALAAALVAGIVSAASHAKPASPLAGAKLASLERFVGSPAAIPSGAIDLGTADPRVPLTLDVALAPRDPAALSSFALAVSTPGNPLYRHFLAPGQFASRFGPTSGAIATVTGALHRIGLETGPISSNDLLISVHTTVGRAASALGVSMRSYRLASGRIAIANADAPRLPADASSHVTAIVGLDNLVLPQPGITAVPPTSARPHRSPAASQPRAPSVAGPQPCTAAQTAATAAKGWTEADLARGYSLPTLYARGDLGSGVRIALYELSSYSASDIVGFQSCYQTHTSIKNIPVDKGTTSQAGAAQAETDIEVALGLTPQASLLVYEAPDTTTGALDEYNTIVTKDTAQVISSSWGECELFLGATANAENTIFEQAASQGQSMIGTPGNEGSEGCLPNDFGVLGAGLGTGATPTDIAIDPGDLTAYVTNSGTGTISVVNVETLATSAIKLATGSKPLGVVVDPITHAVYVTEANAHEIAVINGATCNATSTTNCAATLVDAGAGSLPESIAVDPTTKTVYFTAAGKGQIDVLSEATNKIVAEVPATNSLNKPNDLGVDTAQNFLFFTDFGANSLGRIDVSGCDATTTSGCKTAPRKVNVGSGPDGIAVDPNNKTVYVSNSGSNSISVVNETLNVTAVTQLGAIAHTPEKPALSPSGKALLVPCLRAGTTKNGVVVVSVSSNSPTSLLAGGKGPVAVASDPSVDVALVADESGSRVIQIPLVTDPWDPATQPFVTGVGGTDLTAPGNSTPLETAWNEHLTGTSEVPEGAGGGGISTDFAMPAYQTGPGVSNPFSSGKPCKDKTGDCREVPDVSASADPTHGYLVFEQGKFVPVGGTGAAAALWAAITALLDVQQGTAKKLGFLNPALYKLAGAGKPILNDVTLGSNDYTTTAKGDYPAGRGYDLATGLGSPIGIGLSQYLGWNPRPVVTLLSPSTGPVGGGTVVKVTGTGFLWASSVRFGANLARSFTVISPTEILATSPSGSGTVPVLVTTVGGTNATAPASKFTYAAG
jgi:YVTN family beta-propeller protein